METMLGKVLNEKELSNIDGGSLTVAGFLLGAKAASIYAPAVAKATGMSVATASKILVTGTTATGTGADVAAVNAVLRRILN
jgi:bacteriocin-like protein